MLKKDKSPSLVCPTDGNELKLNQEGNGYNCGNCNSFYPLRNEIINFLSAKDNFYEGTYKNQVKFIPRSEKWFHAFPLWLISNGYLWFTRKYITAGSSVVELGCAGGVKYFGSRYSMTGVDLSESSLELIGDDYNLKMLADSTKKIPLPDESADAVISSYFWEHITEEAKKKILSECRRILKKNGKLIFLFDVETQNPLINLLKKSDSSLYMKEFIEKDGHLGYQVPGENKKLFEKAGFRVIKYFGFERTFLQSVSVYEKMRRWKGFLKYFGKTGYLLSHQPFLFSYIFLLRLIDHSVGKLFFFNWSRMVMAVCEKE